MYASILAPPQELVNMSLQYCNRQGYFMPTSPKHQSSLVLIPHQIEKSTIEQRASDGYFNATAMCKAAGKKISHYLGGGGTQDFLAELSSDAGIPASELAQSIKGGEPHLQGTWVHPQVAVNLAMWLSPKFAVLVSKWVHEWLTGKHVPTKLPYHLEHLRKYPTFKPERVAEMFVDAPPKTRGYYCYQPISMFTKRIHKANSFRSLCNSQS